MFKSILFRSVVLGIACCFFVTQGGLVKAQSVSPLQLKFKLEAFDALTNGAVTSNTTELNFTLLVTNESSTTLNGLNLVPASIILKNYPASINADVSSGPFANNGGAFQIGSFSTLMLMLNQSPLILKNVSTHSSIVAHVTFVIQGVGAITNTGASVFVPVQMDDVIYKPSNIDLIPSILSNINAFSNTVQNFFLTAYKQLTQVQNGENAVYNEEEQLQTGENYIVNQEDQLKDGENYLVNQDTQLDAGENYIVNQDKTILGLLSTNRVN